MNPSAYFRQPWFWLATWFGCGLARRAPGTWGTLGGLPLGIFLLAAGSVPGLLIGTAAIFAAGLWVAREFEKATGEHDASAIVIDEVAGVCVTMLAAKLTFPSLLLAVALFRLFDIWKPWPVSWCDKKLPGAWGVMMDDIAAGAMAAVFLYLLRVYAGIG